MELSLQGFEVAKRYALVQKIGSGGMGSVWLAYDQSLDRLCALKILDPDKVNDDEACKRFLREAKATAQIRSVNVVEVFEHGLWEGLPFIVMELLEGEELGQRLERLGRLPPEDVYAIVVQIARGLVKAHALGIVHRDLKPENVFLAQSDGQETVKILDFGIARHETYSPRDRATKAGAIMGTPCYMSPEQALGKPTDHRCDLWALGVLTFQCLTGKLPFFHEALGGLLTQILHEPIPSILDAHPGLPKRMEAWWRRASERDPERRFQSAGELCDALRTALGIETELTVPDIPPSIAVMPASGPAQARLPSPSVIEFAARIGSDAPVALEADPLVTGLRKRVRRRALWRWGAAVSLVAGLASAGVLVRDRLGAGRAPAARVEAMAEAMDAVEPLPQAPAQVPSPAAPPPPPPPVIVTVTDLPVESAEQPAPSGSSAAEPSPEARPRREPSQSEPRRRTIPREDAGTRDYGI